MIQLILWNGQKKTLKKNFHKFIFPSLNIHQAKSGVKNFSLYWLGGGAGVVPQKIVAQIDVKKILALEFLRSDHFVGGGGSMNKLTDIQPTNQTNRSTDTIVSR